MCEGERDVTEYANWKDSGCELHPVCLECPLPRCVEDELRGRQRRRLDGRSGSMEEMRRNGKTVKDIAASFGVSIRTVQRSLRRNAGKEKQDGENEKAVIRL